MKNICTLTIFFLLFISSISYSVELTPFYGFRNGGDFDDNANDDTDATTKNTATIDNSAIYGLLLSFPYERGKTIEVYYSHQSTDLSSVDVTTPVAITLESIPLTIDYLHIGGTAPITEEKNLLTFVSGGMGFTYMNPDFPDAQSELRPSFSLGVGLKWPITQSIALRLETRGLATLFNNNSALFCNGGCNLQVSGSGFVQIEVFAGIALKF
ncbi:MAG: hypothetical protein RQ982_12020 [Gammaproteobacteria bacterium]|nr:hypothetical protein [Gammaproteobacteria bacterium]